MSVRVQTVIDKQLKEVCKKSVRLFNVAMESYFSYVERGSISGIELMKIKVCMNDLKESIEELP